MRRKNVKAEKKFPEKLGDDAQQAQAAKQGRQDELGDYSYSHEFVHGGYMSMVHRMNRRPRHPTRGSRLLPDAPTASTSPPPRHRSPAQLGGEGYGRDDDCAM